VLSQDGEVVRGYESIYCDAFAIYSLTQLWLVTQESKYTTWVHTTAKAVLKRLDDAKKAGVYGYSDLIPHFPYEIPKGAKPHGVPMIFSQVFWEAGVHLCNKTYQATALAMQNEVMEEFLQGPESGNLQVERVNSLTGKPLEGPQGTAVVPGHVIEDMWFQIEIA